MHGRVAPQGAPRKLPGRCRGVPASADNDRIRRLRGPIRTAVALAAALPFALACADQSGRSAAATAASGASDTDPPTSSQVRASTPSGTAAQSTPVTRADFAGSDACAGCHQHQYRPWAASTHGRAGGEPGPETVIAPFDGAPIVFRDGVVLPVAEPDGAYRFVVRQNGRDERQFEVDGVVGGGHMLGGGTQGFVSRAPDGTVRFLPFDYSRSLDDWFCNTGTRADRGWARVTPEMALADCGDWPPLRVIGTYARFANCQGCHGSQITTVLDPGAGVDTEWISLDINCESCHGPARRHVELMTAGGGRVNGQALLGGQADAVDHAELDGQADAEDRAQLDGQADLADIGLPSRVTDGVEESLGVCFGCHALADVVKEGYLPGAPLADYKALLLPILGDDPYLPDGRVRTFAYQGTHLSSSCYVDGSMTCVSCHEPHGLGYWDINRTPLAGETDDRQCTSCHASKAAAPEAHTFHPASSAGARCVACHMPYMQHPEVGPEVPFARSDHTIPVPRPQLDGRLGVVSACRTCHADRSEIRLQAEVDERWGSLKPHDRVTAGLLAVTERAGSGLAARLLLHPDEPGPMRRFRGLARYLDGWVTPGAALDQEAAPRVRRLAQSTDPDLRALALATVHATDGVRLADPALEPEPVRRRWAMVLGFLADEALAEGDGEAALALLGRALEVVPGDPAVLLAFGVAHNRTGNPASAADRLRQSLAADPVQPLAHVNLGIALAASGDPAGAARAYESALALNPFEALAHFNLGNLRLRSDDLAGAIEAYERAVASGPELARAHMNLAVALARAGRAGEALPHARRAVEFAPGDETAQEVLRQLEAAAGP